MADVRLAVIGAGRIGRVHARNIGQRVPGSALAAVADVRFEAARELASELGVQAVRDHSEVLADRAVDGVVICSSTDTHARLIEEAARAGKPVFCEKPVDLSLPRIKKCLEVVRKAGIILQIGFNRRFDPHFKRVAELVRGDKLGIPHLIRVTSRDPQPPPPEYVKVSGGIFLDMTIHDFDMARFLAGEEVVSVFAAGGVLVDPRIGKLGDVDTAAVTLTYESGAMALIDNSRRACYGYDQRVEVFGSKGCAVAGNASPNNVLVWTGEGGRRDPPHHFFLERYADAYLAEIAEFAECVRRGGKPSVDGRDGLAAARIATAAAKSRRLGRVVKLSEVPA